MYDSSRHFARLPQSGAMCWSDGTSAEEFVLATVHRDHNTDAPERLNAIFRSLFALHERSGSTVVLPLHPRTAKCGALPGPTLLADIKGAAGMLLIPGGFLDIIELGAMPGWSSPIRVVCKEAYFFDTPCLILGRRPNGWSWWNMAMRCSAMPIPYGWLRPDDFLEHGIKGLSPVRRWPCRGTDPWCSFAICGAACIAVTAGRTSVFHMGRPSPRANTWGTSSGA